jgi:signal transduction histidine kinase/CHASE2 domain-containing sensor protein
MSVGTKQARLFLRIALVTLAGLLGWLNGLGRADQLIYDRALTLLERPAPQDVLIVTIDDEAIDILGRWPWPRSLHGMLLERLQDARAVGLNIVFSETDANRAEEDQLLANAIRQHGRVVLPIVLNHNQNASRANLPIAPLAEAAAELGYINVDPDDDGVLRHTTWSNGTGSLPWHQFALSMLKAGGEKEKVDALLHELPPGTKTLIPYAGQPGHFKKVSYLQVLKGEIPPSAIKDKYVLVGAWATGLGDIFPSPVSHQVSGISGIEVIANLLHAARQSTIVLTASPWQTALASALPVLLLCLALPKLSPRQAMFYSLMLLALILAGAVLIMYVTDLWIPPGAALLGVAISYPIWSWRSQEAALRYMSHEMEQLRLEYPPLLDSEVRLSKKGLSRSLDHQMDELNYTLAYARDLRRFVDDGLDGIPDVTMVVDTTGSLRYRNQPAVAYFLCLGIRPPRVGQNLLPALEQAFSSPRARDAIKQILPWYGADHQHPLDTNHLSIEVQDRADQDLLFRISHIHTATGAYAGSVLTISNVSAIRQAERQREESLRFISHDMRAPQNSILALVELSQQSQTQSNSNGLNDPSAALPDQTLSRIAHLAKRTLKLVDNFIELNRAESMSIVYQPLDLVAMLHEVSDEFWAAAKARSITLKVCSLEPIAITRGDSPLITRALSNLLDNAIKYSPNNTTIFLRLSLNVNTWDIEVEDEGPGIPANAQAHLFEPFFRTESVRTSDTEGVGLGLAFVQTVARRHGGSITLHSEVGVGSRFTLRLPAMPDDEFLNP